MRTFIIDGHNLLGAMDKDGSNSNIYYLKNKLRARFQGSGIKVVLVFDNASNYDVCDDTSDKLFQVFFADPSIDGPDGRENTSETGDNRIVRLARALKGRLKGVTFVTSDNRLRMRLGHVDAEDFQSSGDFISEVFSTESDQSMIAISEAEEKDQALKGVDLDKFNEGLLEAFTKPK